MSKSSDQFDSSDCVCSFGMKLTWDINDPKLPQVNFFTFYAFVGRADFYHFFWNSLHFLSFFISMFKYPTKGNIDSLASVSVQ